MYYDPIISGIVYKDHHFKGQFDQREDARTVALRQAAAYRRDMGSALVLLGLIALTAHFLEALSSTLFLLWLIIWLFSSDNVSGLWFHPLKAYKLARLWKLEAGRQQYMIDHPYT